MVHGIGSFLKRLHQDTSGKLSVEMILLLALIALPIIILLALFRTKIIGWFRGQEIQFQDPGTATPP